MLLGIDTLHKLVSCSISSPFTIQYIWIDYRDFYVYMQHFININKSNTIFLNLNPICWAAFVL